MVFYTLGMHIGSLWRLTFFIWPFDLEMSNYTTGGCFKMNVYASRIILVYTMYLTFLAQKLKILWQGIKLHKTGNCFKMNVCTLGMDTGSVWGLTFFIWLFEIERSRSKVKVTRPYDPSLWSYSHLEYDGDNFNAKWSTFLNL